MRKNKIRILHVAQAAGGVDRYIRMLLKYLDKEKFENILVCSQDFHEEDYRDLADSFEQVEMTRAIVSFPILDAIPIENGKMMDEAVSPTVAPRRAEASPSQNNPSSAVKANRGAV